MADDNLFLVKNSFYIGNFQQCVKETQKSKSASSEKDAFMYRAYIGLKKYGVVIEEIRENKSSDLQFIKHFAKYLSADQVSKAKILTEIESKLQTAGESENDLKTIIAASVYYYENDYEKALRLLHSSDVLEAMSMNVQIYLKMHRVDYAKKELKRMQEKDEDSTLTQLSQAWINLYLGGEKLQEAFYIYQELSDKYGATPTLLNGIAVALIGQEKYEEAEPLLQQAIEKDSNNPEALINLFVVSNYLGKSTEIANRYLSQLKDSNSSHFFVDELNAKENELERLIKQYSIST